MLVKWDALTLMWRHCNASIVMQHRNVVHEMTIYIHTWKSRDTWYITIIIPANVSSRKNHEEFCNTMIYFSMTQRTYDAIITSLWRQNDVSTSFWRYNVIFASYVRWASATGSGFWRLWTRCCEGNGVLTSHVPMRVKNIGTWPHLSDCGYFLKASNNWPKSTRNRPDAADIGTITARFWFIMTRLQASPLTTNITLDRIMQHYDVKTWKRFQYYWHISRIILLTKAQKCGAFLFLLLLAWRSCWINSFVVGDLRRHEAYVKSLQWPESKWWRHQMETFPVTGRFPHKGQWRGTLMFSLICVWTNGWANNRNAGDFWDAIVHIMASLQCILEKRDTRYIPTKVCR